MEKRAKAQRMGGGRSGPPPDLPGGRSNGREEGTKAGFIVNTFSSRLILVLLKEDPQIATSCCSLSSCSNCAGEELKGCRPVESVGDANRIVLGRRGISGV